MENFTAAGLSQEIGIYDLYDACKKDLLDKKIYQWGPWGNNYPGREYLRGAIEKNELYVLSIDNEIAGAVILNEKQSPEWNRIRWSEPDGRALVIHALVIAPEHQNKGYGGKLLFYCEKYAAENRYAGVRLDSFTKNAASNMLYRRSGYRSVGVVTFDMKPEGNREYYCFEKLL